MKREGYFEQACAKIKQAGYRVFVRDGEEYGYYSDGQGVAYFQLEWEGWNGVSLSTVNAKGSYCSGYSVRGDHDGYSLGELTKDLLEKGFRKYPEWLRAYEAQGKVVVKYRDLDHFLSEYWDKKNLIEI